MESLRFTSLQLVGCTFQSVIELQQKQNETVIATHQQLTAAFIMAFDAHICAKATTSTNLLYYLQILSKDVYMSPDEGYAEARRLLQKEYGDTYNISTSYLNKILQWSPVRFDDNQRLKRLLIFLIQGTF